MVRVGYTTKRDIDDLIGLDDIDKVHIHKANLEIGANLLKTSNLALKEINATDLGIRNAADTLHRNLQLELIRANYVNPLTSTGHAFLNTESVTAYGWIFRAFDGVAYQECAKLIAGYLDLLRMKASNLTVGEYLKVETGNVIGSAMPTEFVEGETTGLREEHYYGTCPSTPTTVSFATAFSATPAVVSAIYASSYNAEIYSVSTTGFTWDTDAAAGEASWFAIGAG